MILGESQQVDAELWPQAVSSAIPDVIKMMDDVMVDSEKLAGKSQQAEPLLCLLLFTILSRPYWYYR